MMVAVARLFSIPTNPNPGVSKGNEWGGETLPPFKTGTGRVAIFDSEVEGLPMSSISSSCMR
jgi:hypothetical protein